MRRSYYSIFILGAFIFALIFALFTESPANVHAAAPTTSQVYTGAPRGIDLGDYFQNDASYNNKSYFITSVKNSVSYQSGGTDGKTPIIQMTDGRANEVSSVWGRLTDPTTGDDDYNYFDLTKPQTISAWLYFGPGTDNAEKNTIGEGMAFVLQNDPRGTQAISYYTHPAGLLQSKDSGAATGQSLGVWAGISGAYTPGNVKDLAAGAIQKSIAVEFDTVPNTSVPGNSLLNNPVNDSFDGYEYNDVTVALGQHIAWGYPGDTTPSTANSANPIGTYFYAVNGTFYYYQMTHKNVIKNLVMAGYDDKSTTDVAHSWHHFTFKYTPPTDGSNTAKMSYIFDDKDYDGTVRPSHLWDSKKDIAIDLTQLGYPSTKKARWGFTSSTGSTAANSAVNAIVMQSMPALADVDAPTSLYDETQNRQILDLDSNPDANSTVSNKDSLRFDYSLNYLSGLSGTGQISTVINLPDHVDFSKNSDGNVGRIVYGEGANETTVAIPASDISDNKLNLTLNSLTDDNDTAKIQLYGTATIDDSDTLSTVKVNQAHTSYTSSHYTADVMSPEFNISNESLQLKLADATTDRSTVSLNQTGQLNLIASYAKGSTFDGSDLTFYTKVDGGDTKEANSPTVSGKPNSDYSWGYDGSALGLGEHTVEIYATDTKGRKSEPLKYTITVIDYKKLVLSSANTSITSLLNEDTNMSGNLSYDDKSIVTVSGVTMHWVIDDGAETSESVSSVNFTHSIKAEDAKLTEGDHTVTVYADDGTRKSNTLTYHVKVINSSATLDNGTDYKFQNINKDEETNRIVHRSGSWKLAVDSTNAAWSLTAKSSGLINSVTNLPLIGDLVYVSDGQMNSMSSSVLIDKDTTVSKESKVTDIAGKWNSDSGILLRVQPSSSAGSYTGKIAWTLTSSVSQ